MPSPVDELREMRERLAREWAKDCQREGKLPAYGIAAQAAAEHIMATTTEPTMADVEWSDEKHRGAGATDTKGKTWVMFQDDGDYISCIGLGMNTCGVPAEELTPNGKKYKLVEVTGGEHPEVLTTEADYENAPEGTIVAQDGCDSWVKTNTNIWACGVVTYVNRDMSATGPYPVLRWGWGE